MNSSKKQLGIILSTVFFGFLGLSMPYLIFPALFLNPSYSIVPADWSESSRGILLGITLAAYPLGQFVGSPILGALSDEWGRRRILSAALFISAICSLLTAASLEWSMLWLLIASRFSAGLMEGNLAIAQAMAADLKELNKHDTFGKINAAASTAYILGPLMGGLLSDGQLFKSLTIATPFYVIFALFLLLAFATRFAIKECSRQPTTLNRPIPIMEQLNFAKRLRRLFQNKKIKILLIALCIHHLSVDIFFEFGPVFLTIKWLLSPSELSLYNIVLSVALTIGCGWVAKALAARYPARKILTGAILALAFGLAALVATTLPMYMLALFALIGFAIAIASTNLTVQLSNAAPDNIQGEVLGVQTSLRVFGDATICLVGGAILSFSPNLVLLGAAFISLASLGYYLKFSQDIPEQEKIPLPLDSAVE